MKILAKFVTVFLILVIGIPIWFSMIVMLLAVNLYSGFAFLASALWRRLVGGFSRG